MFWSNSKTTSLRDSGQNRILWRRLMAVPSENTNPSTSSSTSTVTTTWRIGKATSITCRNCSIGTRLASTSKKNLSAYPGSMPVAAILGQSEPSRMFLKLFRRSLHSRRRSTASGHLSCRRRARKDSQDHQEKMRKESSYQNWSR
jgi:hypothetical protein